MHADTRNERVAVIAPPPLPGSGGHRTIFRNLIALVQAGFEVEAFVGGRRLRPGRLLTWQTERWFETSGIELIPGWPDVIRGADLVVATTWQSALHLGAVETDGRKAHFVQDYECLFYSEDDERYLLARSAHDLGLASITIGDWLVEVLAREHGIQARSTPFSADLDLYGADLGTSGSRRGMVVANYQPEKPRRCPELMESALRLLLDSDPSIEVVTFGSRRSPRLDGNHRHLGLVDPKALAALYREAGAGLSMSATNPSRVPFEMMAAGLPVVELGGDNTVFDLPEAGCLLAEPKDASVAGALHQILDDRELSSSLGEGGAEFMRERPAKIEAEAFAGAVAAAIEGERPGERGLARMYRAPFAFG